MAGGKYVGGGSISLCIGGWMYGGVSMAAEVWISQVSQLSMYHVLWIMYPSILGGGKVKTGGKLMSEDVSNIADHWRLCAGSRPYVGRPLYIQYWFRVTGSIADMTSLVNAM